jgi:hypothetical protein
MRFWNCHIAFAVALALTVNLAACATPPQPAASTASTAAASTGSGFDGSYRGEGLPDQIVDGCEEAPRAVEIEVKGDHIWTRHSHPSLSGTIDTSGAVSMQNSDGSSNLTGLIQGDVLTATETTNMAPKGLQGVFVNAASTCTSAVQATRGSGGAADGAP